MLEGPARKAEREVQARRREGARPTGRAPPTPRCARPRDRAGRWPTRSRRRPRRPTRAADHDPTQRFARSLRGDERPRRRSTRRRARTRAPGRGRSATSDACTRAGDRDTRRDHTDRADCRSHAPRPRRPSPHVAAQAGDLQRLRRVGGVDLGGHVHGSSFAASVDPAVRRPSRPPRPLRRRRSRRGRRACARCGRRLRRLRRRG